MKRKFGWIPDTKDDRDLVFSVTKQDLPSSVDLRHKMPAVFDQGQIGSCTANAICAAYQYLKNDPLSRLFLYYNERKKEGSINEDSGAQIRTGMKVLHSIGCCLEELEPYIEADFKMCPSTRAYSDAKNRESISYHRVPMGSIRATLASGLPVVFGATVFENFMSDEVTKTGIVPMPDGNEIGGHAILITGYYDNKKMFLVRNSWGINWGIAGYCWIPYDYVMDKKLCSDFWVLLTIKTTKMDTPKLHPAGTIEKMPIGDIIQLIETTATWALNTIVTSEPVLHWRKEQQDEINTIKQGLAALSKYVMDNVPPKV